MLELLMNRRSVRSFKNRQIEDIKINSLINAALTAPSGMNLQPTELIVIKDKDIINKLVNAIGSDHNWAKAAPLHIILTSDISESATWKSDASIMGIIIQLMGEALGLKSCWINLENKKNKDLNVEDFIKNLLGIPVYHRVLCSIAIGYSDENIEPYTKEDLNFNRVHFNRY